MRNLVLFAALASPALPAFAQVTVDLRALDALPRTRPQETARPARPIVPTPPAPPAREPTPPNVASQTTPSPPAATLSESAPAVASLSPVTQPQAAAPSPPPPPPVSDKATTAVAPQAAGLRITFGGGQSDLSPASADAIKELVHAAPSGASATFDVVAYAAPTQDDPSVARRLALSRALAVRSALVADGIASSHIYVRALGAQQVDGGPVDRVDISLLGANAPQQTQ